MQPTTPSSALIFPRKLAFGENDKPIIALPPPTSSRGHQRSRTAIELPPLFTRQSCNTSQRSTFLPFLNHSRERSVSPDRVTPSEAAEFALAKTPPQETTSRSPSPHRIQPVRAAEKLASWFEGSSDPVNISLVPNTRTQKEESSPSNRPEIMEKLFSRSSESVEILTRRPSRCSDPVTPATPNASSNRFSFLKKNGKTSDPAEQEELAALEIRDAIKGDRASDDFSPAAFKNLQRNAESLLRRFQAMHREHMKELKGLRSGKNVQADELEAAQTRNEHLKMQLVEMAESAAEKDKKMVDLRADLEMLRQSRKNDSPNNIRLVPAENDFITTRRPQTRRNRTSDVSTLGESETGSDMSSAISVFSEAASLCGSPGTSVAASPIMKTAQLHYPRVQQKEPDCHTAIIPVLDCQKCHGVKSSEAWEVINIMRMESGALKERISELENAQDAALDMLSLLHLSV